MPDATPPAVTDAAAKTVEDLDLLRGLVAGDDAETPAEKVKETETTVAADAGDDTLAADAGDDALEGDAADTLPAADKDETKEEKPAPGTPDKALQKLQQDMATATRALETVQAKLDAGEKLSAAEKAKVETATRKIDTIRAAIKAKGKDLDLLDPGVSEAVAESLVETDDTIAEMKKRLDAQDAEIGKLRKANESVSTASTWAATKSAYPGVEVESVWNAALTDAMDLTGVDQATAESNPAMFQVLQNAASKLFHGRASAAVKSIAARKPAANNGKTTPKPPVTPNGAKVAESSGVPAPGSLSDEEREMQQLRALVVD